MNTREMVIEKVKNLSAADPANVMPMKLAELMPALHELPRADKFRAMQFLTTELAQEEGAGLMPGAEYPIWSPHDATAAATTLTQYLREQTGGK